MGICPIFPFLLVCFLGFDVGDLSEDGPPDVEGMDASAAHVANLLSTEPADSMFSEISILSYEIPWISSFRLYPFGSHFSFGVLYY